jgi:hypothetical protein
MKPVLGVMDTGRMGNERMPVYLGREPLRVSSRGFTRKRTQAWRLIIDELLEGG